MKSEGSRTLTMSKKEGPGEEVPKVIYIAGPSRSGSTLLGMFIGQQDDVCYVGELENV